MRKAFEAQRQFGRQPVENIVLNFKCRDEIIPVLAALQHVYSQPQLRNNILGAVAGDVNRESRDDRGRQGLSYWQILVLAAVRLGCDLDYDRLQDLAEQHRTLRMMMEISDWDEQLEFGWRRIHDNVCQLTPETIEEISHLLVGEGHRLDPTAATTTRADSFVIDTNIHYPTESSLIRDGLRKIIEIAACVAESEGASGWRQHEHLLKRVKRLSRDIDRIAARKGPSYQKRLKTPYQKLLKLAMKMISRARELCEQVTGDDFATMGRVTQITIFIERTEQVMGTARRRVINGETVPNEDKLFSIFEPHTQLYKRGKAGEPIQFGRLVLIYEDGAGFITHHHVLDRNEGDKDVVVEQTRIVQERLGGKIERASFDRGFHSPENQTKLADIITHPCLPKPGAKQALTQNAQATVQFRQARQNHSGVESTIGALQSGNGLNRCRDASEVGFERYTALAILGRNLHVLGRLVIAKQDELCEAAKSLRRSASAA